MILKREPKGRGLLGRPKHIRKDKIKMDNREIEWELWTSFIWLRAGTSGWHL